jgi:hypothetical protein
MGTVSVQMSKSEGLPMSLNSKQNTMLFAVVGSPYIQEKHFDSHCHYPASPKAKNQWIGALWPAFFVLLVAFIAVGNVHIG